MNEALVLEHPEAHIPLVEPAVLDAVKSPISVKPENGPGLELNEFEQLLYAEPYDGHIAAEQLDPNGIPVRIELQRRADAGQMTNVMKVLGFEFDAHDYYIKGLPKPTLLGRNAKEKFGIDITFIPGKGQLSWDVYLQAFRDGKYPVSTGDEAWYLHDINDDHLTGLALGGKPLQDLLASAAQGIPEEKSEDYRDWLVQAFDTVTSQFTRALSSGSKGEEAAFYEIGGKYLGMDVKALKAVFANAQERLKQYRVAPEVLEYRQYAQAMNEYHNQAHKAADDMEDAYTHRQASQANRHGREFSTPF